MAYSSRPLILIAVALAVMLPCAYGLTASIGNAKMILNTEVVAGTPTMIDRTIKVNNVNDVAVHVVLKPGDALVGITTILDEEFDLQPHESKDARFRIRLEYGGTYTGSISVSFLEIGNEKNGVGLKSTIIIKAEGPQNPNLPPVIEETPEGEPVEGEQVPPVPPEEVVGGTPPPEEGVAPAEDGGVPADGTGPGEAQAPPKDDSSITKSGPNPVVGIIIMVGIIVLGLIVYYLFTRS